jgi:hypothetical protein
MQNFASLVATAWLRKGLEPEPANLTADFERLLHKALVDGDLTDCDDCDALKGLIDEIETAILKEGKDSPAVRECVSKKIPMLMDEGKPQKQAIAIALSMCRKDVGAAEKSLVEKAGTSEGAKKAWMKRQRAKRESKMPEVRSAKMPDDAPKFRTPRRPIEEIQAEIKEYERKADDGEMRPGEAEYFIDNLKAEIRDNLKAELAERTARSKLPEIDSEMPPGMEEGPYRWGSISIISIGHRGPLLSGNTVIPTVGRSRSTFTTAASWRRGARHGSKWSSTPATTKGRPPTRTSSRPSSRKRSNKGGSGR